MTKATKLVKRIVIGNKVFHGINHKTGQRIHAQPGDIVEVTPRQAMSFHDRLVDPKVAKARKEAEEAEIAANAETAPEAGDEDNSKAPNEDDSKES